ncbi:MAG: hypothetical protein ACFFHV_00890, partial [Promethearchaeota archaeon]
MVRSLVAEIIIKLFTVKGYNKLKWVIEHEKSPTILKGITVIYILLQISVVTQYPSSYKVRLCPMSNQPCLFQNYKL